MNRAGLQGGAILIGATAQGLPRIRVVHDGLSTWTEARRTGTLLSSLDLGGAICELLTSSEEEWYGSFVENNSPLPTWSEALATERSQDSLFFASDQDSEMPRPAVVTFYSLRGGVGRTTALGSAAKVLAARGRRVLCIDMDFEAPGLSHFFGLPDPEEGVGTLQLLISLEDDQNIDVRDHIQKASEIDDLYCMPAGRLGAEYARQLRYVDPEIWYRETVNPLHRLLDEISASTISPDVILIDARTGIAPISAPLLFDVSDLAVICFFPHPQTRLGTQLLVDSLFRATNRRSTVQRRIAPEPRFLISPVPPGPSSARVRERALTWVSSWIEPAQGMRSSEVGPLRADELLHFIPYSADVAFRDSLADADGLSDVYGAVSDWVEQLLPVDGAEVGAIDPVSKKLALAEMDFSTGTAEAHTRFLEDFVATRTTRAALDPKVSLVIGRKGTGKTAIFRWLLENPTERGRPVPVMCPNAFRREAPWVLGASGFAGMERTLSETGRSWQEFWTFYTALATYLALGDAQAPSAPEALGLTGLDAAMTDRAQLDELRVVELVSSALAVNHSGLLASRWLRQLDKYSHDRRWLLFDGLDTGFGNDESSRRRRATAVTGLFTFMTESESLLSHLSFKILLRYDIWQSLVFENKSHLLGRSVQLVWRDQAEYFKTVLKQAARSQQFQRWLGESRLSTDVDTWLDEEVFRAWNILVGERMKGGKTTFTRNWVWNRLADGQGDHGPRALSQLFSAAATWERREDQRSPYDRSVLRPRALVPSLETVSGEAVAALKEEFPELARLVECLESVGRTPLSESEIAAVDEEAVRDIELAIEVGLLALPPAGAEESRKFRVPELYRHALKVSRPGQA